MNITMNKTAVGLLLLISYPLFADDQETAQPVVETTESAECIESEEAADTAAPNQGSPESEVPATPTTEQKTAEPAATAPSGASEQKTPEPETALDYENAYELAKDFFDIKVKPEKNMKYWNRQLMGLIKKKSAAEKEKLMPFIKEYRAAEATRDAMGIGRAFEKHRDKFKEPKLATHLEKMIIAQGLNSLLVILKYRLNVK